MAFRGPPTVPVASGEIRALAGGMWRGGMVGGHVGGVGGSAGEPVAHQLAKAGENGGER